ncbi:MAG TPA: hypothetical protein ENG44_01185 [Desulfurococcaceae archaeon]|nr:hypothetical protein [Desulfurococcaceae archaeon]
MTNVLFIVSIPLMGPLFSVLVEAHEIVIDYNYAFTSFLLIHAIGVLFAGIAVDCLCGQRILFWSYVIGVPASILLLVFAYTNTLVYIAVSVSAFLSGFAPIIVAYYAFENVAVWKRGAIYGLGIGFGNLLTYLLFELGTFSSELSLLIVAILIILSGVIFQKYNALTCTDKQPTIHRIRSTLGRGVASLVVCLVVFYALGGVMYSLLYPYLHEVSATLHAYMSTVPYFFVAIAAGLLADSVGRRFIGISGFILLGLGNMMLGLMHDIGFILHVTVIVFAIIQIAYGFVDVYSMVILIDLGSRRVRGIVYSIGILGILSGLFLGSILSSIISVEEGIHRIALVLGMLLLLASIFNLLRVPETLPKEVMLRRVVLKYIREAKKVKEEKEEE